MKTICVFLFSFTLVACNGKDEPNTNQENPTVYCKPLGKEVGNLVSYPDRLPEAEKKTVSEWTEYKTAAGFKMHLPPFVGGLDTPNKQCEAQAGEFEFFWLDGKLRPPIDLKSGDRLSKGVRILYYVKFSPPTEMQVEKYGHNIYLPPRQKWMLEEAFPVIGHEKIWVLPFAELAAPEYLPRNRKDRTLWAPRLLMTEVRGAVSSNPHFSCDRLIFEEVGNKLTVHLSAEYNKVPYGNKCMGWVAFARGADGRLDIFGPQFLNEGATIINAVIKELNSYIVKE